NVAEGELNVLAVNPRELSLAFVAEDDEVRVGSLCKLGTSGLAQLRMNTTAKTLVGRSNDDELLAFLDALGLGVLKDLVGGFTVDLGLLHSTLSAGEFGRGNDLHGVGDLLNVAN